MICLTLMILSLTPVFSCPLLQDISREILTLYSHPRRNLEELERDVAMLKIQLASTKHIEIKEVKLKKGVEGM